MGHAKTNSIWFMEMFVADSKTSGKYLGHDVVQVVDSLPYSIPGMHQ
jgi:hypothetical protein